MVELCDAHTHGIVAVETRPFTSTMVADMRQAGSLLQGCICMHVTLAALIAITFLGLPSRMALSSPTGPVSAKLLLDWRQSDAAVR